jgi:hypothetical protein
MAQGYQLALAIGRPDPAGCAHAQYGRLHRLPPAQGQSGHARHSRHLPQRADADDDRILGLSIGGVDYVSKPFSPGELAARIQVHLNLARRHQHAAPDHEMAAESDPDAVLVNAVKRLISDNLAALPAWPKSPAASAPTARSCRRYSANRPA